MRTKLVLSLIALVSLAAEVLAQPITMVSTTPIGPRTLATAVAAGGSLPRTYDFGTSCAGTPVGSALISEDPTTSADIGDTYTLKLTGAPANTPVVINIDDASLVWQGLNLPFNMAPLGAPGCMAYVAPVVSYWTTTDANGNASISVNIPNNPALDGLRLNAQWMIVQAGRNPLGITATNAFSFKLRMPIVLRSVIGLNNSSTNGLQLVATYNTMQGGVHYSVPVPVQSTEPVRIKKIRYIGGPLSTTLPMAQGIADVRVWSSLASAAASYSSGDIFQALTAPPSLVAPWGVSAYNTPTFNIEYNVLGTLSGYTLSPGSTHFIGLSVRAPAGYSGPGVSDTYSPSCPADTAIGSTYPGNALLIQGPGISSGCGAFDIIATAE